MDWFKEVLPLIANYPRPALLCMLLGAALFFTGMVAGYGPASASMRGAESKTAEKAAPSATSQRTLAPPPPSSAATPLVTDVLELRIDGLRAYPPYGGAQVRVIAKVNGVDFKYPHTNGVNWLEVGPGMSGATYRLPKAKEYELTFEAISKQGATETRHVSQEVVRFPPVGPEPRAYALHPVNDRSRALRTSFEVQYSISPISTQ